MHSRTRRTEQQHHSENYERRLLLTVEPPAVYDPQPSRLWVTRAPAGGDGATCSLYGCSTPATRHTVGQPMLTFCFCPRGGVHCLKVLATRVTLGKCWKRSTLPAAPHPPRPASPPPHRTPKPSGLRPTPLPHPTEFRNQTDRAPPHTPPNSETKRTGLRLNSAPNATKF